LSAARRLESFAAAIADMGLTFTTQSIAASHSAECGATNIAQQFESVLRESVNIRRNSHQICTKALFKLTPSA
jgi:isocitrate lyase